jgi:carbonic anhydrase
MITALEALERLRDGNRRFVSDGVGGSPPTTESRRRDLLAGQEPFAIILGCSDSRAPAEIVFDQGLGDLFVIRVAGNIVAPSQVGSVEFAAERFGTRLVVVLGHTMCGAVLATLEELKRPTGSRSPNLRAIVDMIRPSVEPLIESARDSSASDLLPSAVRANIRACADHLRHGSQLLERLIADDGLLVVCAEYSLETGIVDIFDGPPRTSLVREYEDRDLHDLLSVPTRRCSASITAGRSRKRESSIKIHKTPGKPRASSFWPLATIPFPPPGARKSVCR